MEKTNGSREVRVADGDSRLTVEAAGPPIEAWHDDFVVLARAIKARHADPMHEHERLLLLGEVLEASRDANRAMHTWISQSLSEYRGSHSAWDLASSSGEFGRVLEQYLGTVRRTAERLRVLSPVFVAAKEIDPRLSLVRDLDSRMGAPQAACVRTRP
ncbi:MAG: hypothetical protein ABI877_01085 [Gemmatimonadaceae bacterium]